MGNKTNKQKEITIPPLIFDKIWRSRYATNKYIKNVVADKIDFNGKRILDFGCGTGSYSLLFNSDKYVGIDTDCERIDYAKKKLSPILF